MKNSVFRRQSVDKTSKIADLLDEYLGAVSQRKRRSAPLDLLIGTILSQNTNDKNSHRAYVSLRSRFPTWRHVREAPVRSIASAIRVGGMNNQKSARIKALLQEMHRQSGERALSGLEKMDNASAMARLTSFDGVGPKTAACVLLFSLGRDVFPVDTHIHRILNRLGLVLTSSPEKTFEAMEGRVPKGRAYSFHTNLIRFGRTICLAQHPHCDRCPLYALCEYGAKGAQALLPRKPTRRRDPYFMLLDEI